MCAGVFSIAEGYAMEEKKNKKVSIKKERKPLQVIDSKENYKAVVCKEKKTKKNKDPFNDDDKENQNTNTQTKQKVKTKKSSVKKTNKETTTAKSKKDQKSQTPQKILSKSITFSKEEIILEEPKTPEKSKEDDETVPVFSPLLIDTPTTVEYKYWKKFRLIFVLLKYPNLKRCAILSPEVRKIYRKHDTENLFKRIRFEKKTVFQADFLINPEDEVLSEKGKWETNLERMKKGLAPIAKKGITHEDDRSLFINEEIWKEQDLYKVDLQHVTQKDTGLDEDPIVEMTHKLHLGIDLYFILEKNLKDETIYITHSKLTKKEALSILKKEKDNPSRKASNSLHPLGGDSRIDRPSFNKWRKAYWKNRGEEIEKGNFIKTPPKYIKRAPLFPSKELDFDEE